VHTAPEPLGGLLGQLLRSADEPDALWADPMSVLKSPPTPLIACSRSGKEISIASSP
jgi:hypothetical protein